MNKWLALGFSLALSSLACGSSDSSDKGTDTKTSVGTGTSAAVGTGTSAAVGTGTGATTSTETGTCAGANSNALMGACTMMGQCFELYDKTAPTAAVVKAMGDACTGTAGGTWSTTGCALPKVGCTCTETQSATKTVYYWSDAMFCEDCTGACKTLK